MSKGGDWERDVCKFLSKWVQGTEKPYIFWRGRGSGSAFTVSPLVGESFSGDVYSVRDDGKFLTDRFNCECKTGYKEASLDKHLKYNKSDPIKDFWVQTLGDSLKSNKYPLLMYKKKGMPTPWVCIYEKTFSTLVGYLYNSRYIHIHWRDLSDMYVFEMKEFFDTITPKIIKEAIEVINVKS